MAESQPEERAGQPTAQAFDRLYAGIGSSSALNQIWSSAYGDEYPEEAAPFSFVTRSEIKLLLGWLGLGPGKFCVDIGCGSGGISLFVANATGAHVTGVDWSAIAIESAMEKSWRSEISRQVSFLVADAAATQLPSASFDGAISIDALQLMPRPKAVLEEVARILRPGGVLAFTTWLGPPVPGRFFVMDYRPLLEENGFTMEECVEPEHWLENHRLVYRLFREREADLRSELGESIAGALLSEANRSGFLKNCRRINLKARKL
jgi:ubiquinone/menaquinone biosynthesis C-methylase UbiE